MSLTAARSRLGSSIIGVVLVACLLITGLVRPAPASADVTFRINGGGFGHGIGLSQYGAKGLADKGWNYGDIVRFYYGGVRDVTTSATKVYTLEYLGKNKNPVVNVNIDASVGKSRNSSTRTTWSLRSWRSKLVVKSSTGTTLTILPTADAYYTFAIDSATGKVRVGGKSYASTIRVSSLPASGVSPALVVVGSESGPFDRYNVRYRGEMNLTVVGTRLRAVNSLRMEEYLYGVVPRESPSSWPAEALKAQAVVARSYAWATNPPTASTPGELSDILLCTTWSQVYGGHSRVVRVDGKDTEILPYETANAAVQSTYGRVAYYAPSKKIIQTFFSSSSGGHTASIEDVWGGSTPQPYYKGVIDADQNGPDYRWPTVYKTGAELAAALRAKDGSVRDYSEASPATVIGVSHDKASSGYVRNAIVRWSNGKSHTVDGDVVRGALGLKSTKFTILGPAWGPLIQETDPKIAWSGTWGVWKSTAHSGGAYKYSWQQGATSKFSIMGTGFRWYALKWPKGGRANVLIDGVKVATVSLYSPTNKYHQAVYTATGLSVNAPHTISVEVLRTKDASSTGYAVGVDALRVQSGALVPIVP